MAIYLQQIAKLMHFSMTNKELYFATNKKLYFVLLTLTPVKKQFLMLKQLSCRNHFSTFLPFLAKL